MTDRNASTPARIRRQAQRDAADGLDSDILARTLGRVRRFFQRLRADGEDGFDQNADDAGRVRRSYQRRS